VATQSFKEAPHGSCLCDRRRHFGNQCHSRKPLELWKLEAEANRALRVPYGTGTRYSSCTSFESTEAEGVAAILIMDVRQSQIIILSAKRISSIDRPAAAVLIVVLEELFPAVVR
jgi:hypothetical protein